VACGGDAANERSSERVGKSAAACLNTGGLQARFVDNDDELFADAVHVTTTGNKATVNLYDSSDAAKENYRDYEGRRSRVEQARAARQLRCDLGQSAER